MKTPAHTAALSAAVCAGIISGMAVTASAAETMLLYRKDGTALSEFAYGETATVNFEFYSDVADNNSFYVYLIAKLIV